MRSSQTTTSRFKTRWCLHWNWCQINNMVCFNLFSPVQYNGIYVNIPPCGNIIHPSLQLTIIGSKFRPISFKNMTIFAGLINNVNIFYVLTRLNVKSSLVNWSFMQRFLCWTNLITVQACTLIEWSKFFPPKTFVPLLQVIFYGCSNSLTF